MLVLNTVTQGLKFVGAGLFFFFFLAGLFGRTRREASFSLAAYING